MTLTLAVTLASLSVPVLAQPAPKQTIFAFHSGFWVNLHHSLYAEAISGKPELGCEQLTARSEWTASVLFYKQQMISHDLLLDQHMIVIKNSLEDEGSSSALVPAAGLSPEMVAILNKAAPSYRANCWPVQNQRNRRWIRLVSPFVDRYGERLKNEISSLYETQWPRTPIRVDVTNYASWAGAYTTIEPTRITVSSTDPGNQGTAALEVLFHEASHGISGKLQRMIAAECARKNVLLPRRDLWHAVIFYTTGELVRREFPGYVPYAFKNGLWKGAWPMYIGPLERDWQPYLEGKTSAHTAIAALVNDVGQPKK